MSDMINKLTDPQKEELEAQRRKSDADSRKMGDLLLAGWCMLGDTCPRSCSVPLMRNKENRDFCVSCGKWRDEVDSKSINKTPGDIQATTKSETQQQLQLQSQEEEEEEEEEEEIIPVPPIEKVEIKTFLNRRLRPTVSQQVDDDDDIISESGTISSIQPKLNLHLQNARITQQTIQVLYAKLEVACSDLEHTERNQITRSVNLTQAIAEYANAIHRLQQLV